LVTIGDLNVRCSNLAGVGTYRTKRAPHYHVLARRRELEELKVTFDDPEEFSQALREKPSNLQMFWKHIKEAPKQWRETVGHDFPVDGLLLIFTKFPSGNSPLKST
jgi:hypothetical protein